jgi:hypothetical protein
MKPSEEIAAIEQNAQAKIQFWNAVRKMIPGTGTITNGTASRSLLLKGKKKKLEHRLACLCCFYRSSLE